jgi:RNA polymerase sigma factor (sigma-70 family)
MIASQASNVFHRIRALALHRHEGETDGDLLDRYIRRKDDAAFEALVRRHGPMVLGVCRRILANSHDAEDAFQATFLVLVRKAPSIRPAGMVGNWLYGVAHRTALEARRSAARRRAKEAQVAPRTETPDDPLAQLRPLLDRELPRLPDKYRAILVLCDLEGRTRKEVAQQLGLPEGTVASRLGRARVMLAKRLTRDGVTLSGGGLAAALAQEAASGSAPPSLVLATVKAATACAAGPAAAAAVSAPVTALTEGVLKTMLLSKLKITAWVLLVLGAAGFVWGNHRSAARERPTPQVGQQVARAVRKAQRIQAGVDPDTGRKEGGKKTAHGNKPPDQDPADQVKELVRKGLQAYRASKGRDGDRPGEQASDLYAEAFLQAFQVASELARAKGKRAPGGRAAADQEQVKQVLELMSKGLQAYQASNVKKGERTDDDALDLYAEAFLKAFQVASQLARAKQATGAKPEPEDQAILDSCGPAFRQAYDRAKALKEALQAQKASGGQPAEKVLEALDVFLKAGKEFEHAVKRRAKARAVQHATREIAGALRGVEKTAHDKATELAALEEIEHAVRDMKKRIEERKDGK